MTKPSSYEEDKLHQLKRKRLNAASQLIEHEKHGRGEMANRAREDVESLDAQITALMSSMAKS